MGLFSPQESEKGESESAPKFLTNQLPIGSFAACSLAQLIFSWTASIPITSAPSLASGSQRSPAPHPTSNIFKFESGSDVLLDCLQRPPVL